MNYLKVLLTLSLGLVILYIYFYVNKENSVLSINTLSNKNYLFDYFTCPHLTPASYDASHGINNARIAILMAIGKASDYAQFVYAINATKCYATHFGYQMEIIELYGNKQIENYCNHTVVSKTLLYYK